jgi:hypothetical protein
MAEERFTRRGETMKRFHLSQLVLGLALIAWFLAGCADGKDGGAAISVAATDPPVQTRADTVAPSSVPAPPTATLSAPPAVAGQPVPSLDLAPVVSLDDISLPSGSILQDNLVLPSLPAFDGSMESLWASADQAFALDQENMALFTAPAELSALQIVDFFEGEAVRLGGVVVEGRVKEGEGGGRVVWTRDELELTIEFERQPGAEWLLSFGFAVKED